MRTLEEIVKEECPSPANSKAWNRQRITAKAVAEHFADGFRTVLLADEVGMGKTYTALAVMANYIFQSDINDRRVILIVPANHVLASKWEQEIHNFNSTYLREERLKSKRLRPIALDGIMELVKNLHDYESNAKIQRQPEYLKNYFKWRLAQWVKYTRSRYKKKWSKQYEIDGSNPDALGMSSWISPMALNLFFRDKMGDPDDRRLEQLVGNLENDDNDYFLLRELLNDFLRNQDFFEANVIIIRMSKLQRRARTDNPDFQLLCTYLAARSLRGTSLDTRKKAYATLSAEKLLAYGDKPGMLMDKLNGLADIDLWGLREAVDEALKDTGNALRGFLRKERKCLNLRNELDELICSVIKRKIADSGIGLAVVDEVHNWKSGESNGAKFFRECLGPVIPNKLVMSATPIQLEEGEMRTVFSVIAGEDKDDKSLLAVQEATEPAGICVREGSAFHQAWAMLDQEDVEEVGRAVKTAKTTSDIRQALEQLGKPRRASSSNLAAFARTGLAYRDALDRYQTAMRNVCIRHVKDRKIRSFHCGEEFSDKPGSLAHPHTMYATHGIGTGNNAMLDFIGMRAQQLISRSANERERAKLLGGLNSSYQAFLLGAMGKIFDKDSDAGGYVEFFRRLIHDAQHPKVEVTVTRCLDNLLQGRKTLVFCQRRETQKKIALEIATRLDETDANKDAMRKQRGRFLDRRESADFHYVHCLGAAQARARIQSDSGAMDALVELAKEKKGVFASTPGWPTFLRLLDLCVIAVAYPNHILGQSADMILRHNDALREYMNSRDPLDERDDAAPAEPFVNMDAVVMNMVEKGIAEFAEGDSVWRRLGESSPLALIGGLLDSEYEGIRNRSAEEKAYNMAEILLAIRRCLLRTVLHPGLFSPRAMGEETNSAAVVHRILSPDESGISQATRVRRFLKQIVAADGSIMQDSDKSLRQYLWHGVMALQDLCKVRYLNGDTDPSTRDNLCAAFNTPLAPHVLICTAIGSEGIDLHRQCAEVIHHDLPWNPAMLEQRTGRIDRVGSLAVNTGGKVCVGIPFLASNYDEIAYNIVLARAQKMEVLFGKPEFADPGLEEESIEDNGPGKIIDPDPDSDDQCAENLCNLPDKMVGFFSVDFSCDA